MIRSFIHLLSQHSNWKASSVRQTLEEEVYPTPLKRKKLMKGLILSLGVGWFVLGVLFFFAYNWDELHRFTKLGLAQLIFVIFAALAWKSRLSPLIKNINLTCTAVLVGVLFALLAQIYQSGANAYDFFLAWFAALFILVIYFFFEPFWLVLIVWEIISLCLFIYQESYAVSDC
jgi:uncharacterized membrane protein